MNKENKQLLTIAETAVFLAFTESRIRYEVFRKRIPFIKIGRSIRFDEKDLISWVMSQKQTGASNETK